MAQNPDRLDVAQVMHEIRDDTRLRHREITGRIARAHKQIEEQIPKAFDSRLRHLVQGRGEMFSRYYQQMVKYLAEQEPNYVNVRRTLAEINRLIEEPTQPPGHRDRWWNPRTWIKRTLTPLRRYVMRRQYDLNALMRDTLIYLFNHSTHIETQRMELEMGVQMHQAMEVLLEQIEGSRRFLQEWLRVLLPPIADYIDELHRHSAERQVEAISSVRDEVTGKLERFSEDWAVRLDQVARQAPDSGADKSVAPVGFDTVQLADSLRGSPEEIRRQQARYVEFLRGQQDVLDAGCGRGEFLELLRDAGISAYGVDSDQRMVSYCRDRGLDVRSGDIIAHLAGLPDGSLGGLVALQLIEHFDFTRLFQLLRLAARKTSSKGVIILETVNPTCLTTFSGAFYADPTHQRPIHPEAIRRMVELHGFGDVRIEYLNPIEESDKLEYLASESNTEPALRKMVETINRNLRRMNSLLYNYADYAVIGRKTV